MATIKLTTTGMEVCWGIGDLERKRNSVITVGTFDGIHLGHQFILDELKRRGAEKGLLTTLVTFHPHPKLVVGHENGFEIKLLTTIEEKIAALEQQRLDRVVIIRFTREFSQKSSHEFVKDVLYEKVGFQEFVIGHDHAFGKDRQGGVATLRDLAKKVGFEVTELQAYANDEMVVSSTKIRDLLMRGDIRRANRALGRPYHLQGEVERGSGRGKRLQFPTANIKVDDPHKLIPADGVYAVHAEVAGRRYGAMMNIGVRPTFGDPFHALEVHLFDFDRELYGEPMRIEFVARIRDERKFANEKELIQQLEKDKESALSILNN